jgi:hypothetical protein
MMTTNLHLLPKSRMVGLYPHPSIYIYGMVFNYLFTEKILPFLPLPYTSFSIRNLETRRVEEWAGLHGFVYIHQTCAPCAGGRVSKPAVSSWVFSFPSSWAEHHGVILFAIPASCSGDTLLKNRLDHQLTWWFSFLIVFRRSAELYPQATTTSPIFYSSQYII